VAVRLLRYLVLLALMLAPFGRMSVAEAKAMPHHGMSMMASHCPDPSPPDGNKAGGMSVDCMIACAAMVASPAATLNPPAAVELAVAAIPLTLLAGIRPEAEPPLPRLS
jgi:hypothetical protein